jgi:hypothetical protein
MKSRSLPRWAALAVVALAVVAALGRRRKPPRRSGGRLDPRTEAQLDEALKQTFPASDPVALGRIE